MAIADIFIASKEQYAPPTNRTGRIATIKALIHPDWITHKFGTPLHPTELALRAIWDMETRKDANDPDTLWIYCSPLPAEHLNGIFPSSAENLSPVFEVDRERRTQYQDRLGRRLLVFPATPWPERHQLQEALEERSLSVNSSATLVPFGVYYDICVRSVGQSIKEGLGITDGNYLYPSGETLSIPYGQATEITRWKHRQRYRSRHKRGTK